MPLFEFDAGHLVPAQVGHAVTDPVDPAILDAVRAQVLEILGLPVFPVTWQDDDGAPRLTAMDPAGHAVSIEVLDLLDARALVAALARAGDSGERGWIEVAQSYPRGVGAFRRDWNAFREAQPVGTTVTARVHVVAARIDDDVRQALDALAGAGVVVHELAVRAMSSGRLFLDVTEVSVPVAPLPWLLPGRTPATLEHAPGPHLLPERPAPHRSVPAAQPQTDGTPTAPAPAAPDGTAAPASPSGDGGPAPRSRRAARRAVRAVEQPEGPEHAASEPAGAPDVGASDAGAPDAGAPDAGAPDEDLLSIGANLGTPTPLVWTQNGRRQEATLQPDGWIVVGDTSFPAPEAAAAAVSGDRVNDAWGAWRFGEHGPTLREAREEVRAHRSRAQRRAASTGPGLRRRDRRRRAASE